MGEMVWWLLRALLEIWGWEMRGVVNLWAGDGVDEMRVKRGFSEFQAEERYSRVHYFIIASLYVRSHHHTLYSPCCQCSKLIPRTNVAQEVRPK